MIARHTIAVAMLCTLLASCGGTERVAEPVPGATSSTPPPSHSPIVIKSYALLTHCGIHEVTYQGKWYVRNGGILDDGQGNPPRGWGNPTQIGTLTILENTATFTDGEAHRETFSLRPGADTPLRMCA